MASAESETSVLRAELYAARRTVGSFQQHLQKITEDRDSLAQKLQEHQAQDSSGELQKLQNALRAESEARNGVEEVLQKLTLERQRLQRARDELATNLLAAQQRAQEAEEDQQRAEEQTAAAVAELRALQARLDASTANGPHDNDSAPATDGEGASRELELERSRNAVLVAALSSAKGEKERAQTEAAALRQRVQQLEQQLQMAHSAGLPASRVPGQPAESASMPKSEQSVDGLADPENAARQIATLKRQVAQLKASRDKLLAELDVQFVEADRLNNENSALTQALQEAQEAGAAWERQAQEATAQLERLKDLLEESALWRRDQPPPPQPPRPETSPPAAAGENGASMPLENGHSAEEAQAAADREYCQTHILDLEQRYMQECARSAALDLQVRALCSELNRAAQATSGLGRSVLPALNGIESRLSQLQALHLTSGH